MLVNCAGIGAVGAFSRLPLERQLAMIHINVEALVALTGLYLPRLVAKGHGAVINVASTAAMAPVPYLAVYAASKAFVLSFSEALWAECRRYGVRVVATCPGPVATGFHARAESVVPPFQLNTGAVVAAALDSLDRDRPTIVQRVPGFGLLYAALASPVVPRRLRLVVGERVAHWCFQQS
jgi:short-subunit dehydrogenase